MKLYADEPGHEEVRAVETLVVSCLARVEVPSALWRKCRSGELSDTDAAVLCTAFEIDYAGTSDIAPRFLVLGVPPSLLEDAARQVAVHGLRAYDALRLASARAARETDSSCDTFACTDVTLRAAAAAVGFALLPGASVPAARPQRCARRRRRA